jgi:hypothetical protein
MRFAKLVTGLAAVASSAAFGVTPASAMTPSITGPLCDARTMPDPADPTGTLAVVQGGPIVAYDADAPDEVAEVYLFCELQVGGSGYASDPDDAVVDAEGVDFAYIAPAPVKLAVRTQTVFACAEIWIATASGHLSLYQDKASGTWVANAAAAQCPVAVEVFDQ